MAFGVRKYRNNIFWIMLFLLLMILLIYVDYWFWFTTGKSALHSREISLLVVSIIHVLFNVSIILTLLLILLFKVFQFFFSFYKKEYQKILEFIILIMLMMIIFLIGTKIHTPGQIAFLEGFKQSLEIEQEQISEIQEWINYNTLAAEPNEIKSLSPNDYWIKNINGKKYIKLYYRRPFCSDFGIVIGVNSEEIPEDAFYKEYRLDFAPNVFLWSKNDDG